MPDAIDHHARRQRIVLDARSSRPAPAAAPVPSADDFKREALARSAARRRRLHFLELLHRIAALQEVRSVRRAERAGVDPSRLLQFRQPFVKPATFCSRELRVTASAKSTIGLSRRTRRSQEPATVFHELAVASILRCDSRVARRSRYFSSRSRPQTTRSIVDGFRQLDLDPAPSRLVARSSCGRCRVGRR